MSDDGEGSLTKGACHLPVQPQVPNPQGLGISLLPGVPVTLTWLAIPRCLFYCRSHLRLHTPEPARGGQWQLHLLAGLDSGRQ
jgi:hypothetical protein